MKTTPIILLAALCALSAPAFRLHAGAVYASDAAAGDYLGVSVSQSGTTGLAGAFGDTFGGSSYQGSAYVFRNLNTASGTITQNAKLTASDGTIYDDFGYSVSQSGSVGLVGAFGANSSSGSAYVFNNLDTASGTVTQNAKLTASDGASGDHFGISVSLSGSIGLVGAYEKTVGTYWQQGAAYVFRNLDTASGAVTENVKLTASDGTPGDWFGSAVSQSGNIGLVGAKSAHIGGNWSQGAAYVFRNLDTATGIATQNAKLIASDGARGDHFGSSVSQSGSIGLVGAYGKNILEGAVYLFRDLDTATGTVTQNVKLTASYGDIYERFGYSVSLDGDNFIIGAYRALGDAGKAYTGSVSSLTTLDTGSTSRTISGISFVSQDNWVIGETTDNNQVTLSAGDSANVAAAGKQVFIGKNAGSDNNNLTIAGSVTANIVNIGSTAGNVGNTLQLDSTAIFGPVTFRLTSGNFLSIQGDYSNFGNLITYLGSSTLQVWDGGLWNTITSGNAFSFLSTNYASGYTTFGVGSSSPSSLVAVPETSTWVMGLLALGASVFLAYRKKRSVA